MIKPLDGSEAALVEAQKAGIDAPVRMTIGEVAVSLKAVRVLRNMQYEIESRAKYVRQVGEKLASGEFVGEGSLELMKEFSEDIRIMKEMLDV
jgi:hypothetical protein